MSFRHLSGVRYRGFCLSPKFGLASASIGISACVAISVPTCEGTTERHPDQSSAVVGPRHSWDATSTCFACVQLEGRKENTCACRTVPACVSHYAGMILVRDVCSTVWFVSAQQFTLGLKGDVSRMALVDMQV